MTNIPHALWVIRISGNSFSFNRSPGYFLMVYKLGPPRLFGYEFCTAYVDNILIYTSGLLRDYKAKVHMVLKKITGSKINVEYR